LYPPISPEELVNAHGFNNIVRVVLTQNGVYGLTQQGQWIEFRPLKNGRSEEMYPRCPRCNGQTRMDEPYLMCDACKMVVGMRNEKAFRLGHGDGWHAALYIYGLRDCTIRNDSKEVMNLPIGRREAYIDLEPGEQVEIRTVDPDFWWEKAARTVSKRCCP
jgi:hypothetical protein